MNYLTYILFSPSCQRFYIGQTQDIQKRLDRHNKGQVKSTKTCRPWELVHFESFPSRSEAFKLEQKLKSFKSQSYLQQWIHNKKE